MPADAPKPTTTSERRYRSPFTFIRFPYDALNQFVYCQLTGTTKILSQAAVKWLGRCQTFATIEEHAAALVAEYSQEEMVPYDATIAILNELVAASMLISDDNFIENYIGRATDAVPPPQISSLAVPTRNRPQLLQRCLESYARCQFQQRDFRFVISDQSDDVETQRTNLQLLKKLKMDAGIPSTYIGAAEKVEFARQLAEYAGVGQEIVNFCLLNDDSRLMAYGANRNALLLATIDEMMLQVDDDTLCRVAANSEVAPGLVLTSQFDPTLTSFMSEEQTKEIEQGFSFSDVFALHEQLLGKSISTCVDQYGGDYNVTTCDSSFFHRLEPRRVSVTMLGSVGELGVGTSFYSMFLEGTSRDSLVRNENDYYYTMINQQGKRAVDSATISSGTWCSSLNLGLDNRQLLPPFMPVQRNEDGVFAAIVKASGEGYFGYLPHFLLHMRGSRMSSRADLLQDLRKHSASINCGNVLGDLIGALTAKPDRRDAGKNIVALGESLVDLGSRPLSEFEEVVRLSMIKVGCSRATWLEEKLKAYRYQPDYWAKDLTASLSVIRESLPGASYTVPGDLLEVFGEAEARAVFQGLVRKFGELLRVWPDLRQAARELQQRGVCLGKRV